MSEKRGGKRKAPKMLNDYHHLKLNFASFSMVQEEKIDEDVVSVDSATRTRALKKQMKNTKWLFVKHNFENKSI